MLCECVLRAAPDALVTAIVTLAMRRGTNYVQWYPFNKDYEPVAGEENFIARYNFVF